MKTRLLIISLILLFGAGHVLAQHGGKAEPQEIKFTKGKSSAVLTESLKNSEESDYSFNAKKGQTVSIRISSIPNGKYSAFSIKGDDFEFGSYEENKYSYTFTAPETGNYLIFVKNIPAGKVHSAKFTLTLKLPIDQAKELKPERNCSTINNSGFFLLKKILYGVKILFKT